MYCSVSSYVEYYETENKANSTKFEWQKMVAALISALSVVSLIKSHGRWEFG